MRLCGSTSCFAFGLCQVSQADVDVWIFEVNDPPEITAPDTARTLQADTLVVAGIVFSDPDLATTVTYDANALRHEGRVRLTMWVDAGTFSLGTLVGLSFIKGSGLNDAELVMEASLENLNAAVRELRYVCAGDRGCDLGEHQLHMTLDDKGYTGGEPLQDSHTIRIDVEFNPAQ